jgi:hypothetical protein
VLVQEIRSSYFFLSVYFLNAWFGFSGGGFWLGLDFDVCSSNELLNVYRLWTFKLNEIFSFSLSKESILLP